MVRIYFAHPKKTYDTELEKKVMNWINLTFKGYKVVNPSLYFIEDGVGLEYYKAMYHFYKVMDTCDLVIVYVGDKMTDGVKKEIVYAKEHNISVIEVPQSVLE